MSLYNSSRITSFAIKPGTNLKFTTIRKFSLKLLEINSKSIFSAQCKSMMKTLNLTSKLGLKSCIPVISSRLLIVCQLTVKNSIKYIHR